MKQLQTMYGSTPPSFANRIQDTLVRARVPEQPRRRPRGLVLAAALLAVLATGAAVAAFVPQTAQLFGLFYGERMQEKLLQGRTAVSGQSTRVGDVLCTLGEVTAIDSGLYLTAQMKPASETILLMPEDATVNDPCSVSEGASTYAELAGERKARIRMASLAVEAVGVDEGAFVTVTGYGANVLPEQDGSLTVMLQIPAGTAVEPGERYALRFWLSNWEVTPEGKHLREDTSVSAEWTVTVEPTARKEEE